MKSEVSFIYRDSAGQVTARTLLDWVESDEFLQGVCREKRELRTFRRDRVLEVVPSGADIAEPLARHRAANPPPPPTKRKNPPPGTYEVCFTGFKAATKAELSSLAESVGIFVRPAVTKKLTFLCCGETAGPAKVTRAREQGVIVLQEGDFRVLVETGELPDSE